MKNTIKKELFMVKKKNGSLFNCAKNRRLMDVFIEGIVYALGIYTGRRIKSKILKKE